MAIKVVQSEEPSGIVVKEKPSNIMAIPKEETYRLRRAVRSMADQMSPWALKTLISLAEQSDDPKFIREVCNDILKISMARKSNEELDPEQPTVDSTATRAQEDALEALESKTAEGTDHDE